MEKYESAIFEGLNAEQKKAVGDVLRLLIVACVEGVDDIVL